MRDRPDPLEHDRMKLRQREGPATNVFVVDDDATLRHALERFLRSAGFVVETFGSAEEFIDSGKTGTHGALVVDVRMPGMGGPALQRQLDRAGSPLRTFVISAVEDENVREAVMASGACGWFTKPLDGEALVTALIDHGCLPGNQSASAGSFD
jgi:FixJ family two-component response regulator